MPTNSLMDLFGPRDIGGNATGLGDMLSQRSNSLIGLGLGLTSGTAQDPYGNAMRGYAQGRTRIRTATNPRNGWPSSVLRGRRA